MIALPVSLPTPIALCITDLDPGGAERALVQIVTRLDRQSWAPVVYCLSRRGELADVLEAAGIETHCLNASPRDAFVILRLAKLLKRQRPALLQTFLFHANLAGRIAATIARVPIVVAGIRVAEREKRWHLRLERWTKRLVDQHVCVSQAVASFTERELHIGADEVSVIANGVDAQAFTSAPPANLQSLGVPPNARTLLFVGRLHPQKGVRLLLDSFSMLTSEYGDLHLLMVGSGPLEQEEKSHASALGIASRVHWLGSRRDVPGLMRASTLLVLPSLWEGMPNVVLEAMAAGLPVVATAVDGTTEVLTDGVTGFLCEPGSAVAITDCLRAVLQDPVRATACAHRAQTSAVKYLTWDASVAGYQRLWRSLVVRHD